ncbi:hypothetical protein EV192_106740 [Actinocrispum wychmicini]|uniref:Tetratricopeptide repeat protein n=1 Tax=Actinocrispum wychmicini TaxID=1213861 RepID=A0A4R2JCH5_9PSEU|nr:hypothetical protein EV192_106740 [Actinocrispum wychmicini]
MTVTVVAVERADVLSALIGLVATLVVLKVGVVVGALALRVPVHKIVVGIGPRLFELRKLVVRVLPVTLNIEVLPTRPRYVGAAITSALFGLAAVAVMATSSQAMAVGGAAALVQALVRFPRPRAAQPGALAVFDLVQAGKLDEAERLVGRLNGENPRLRTLRAARVLVLEARGRYSEALTLAIGMSDDEDDAATTMAAVAGLTGAAVEAGQLEASQGLPVAARALNEAIELGKPSHMMDGVRALLALLAGDPQLAVRLARLACQNNDDSLGRADDLATLARAYMAAGDNSAARRALAQAERLVPWWPRVALTRRRLDLA